MGLAPATTHPCECCLIDANGIGFGDGGNVRCVNRSLLNLLVPIEELGLQRLTRQRRRENISLRTYVVEEGVEAIQRDFR